MKRRGHTDTPVLLMQAEEFFTPTIEMAECFGTSDPSALLVLSRALPDFWDNALEFIAPAKKHTAPMAHLPYSFATGLTLAAWHDGSDYQITISGRPDQILAYTNLTANEQEHLQIELNRRASRGQECIGVMTTRSTSPPDLSQLMTQQKSFEFAGFIAAQRRIHTETLRQARHASQGGARLQLVSENPPDFIASLMTTHGLATQKSQFVDSALLSQTIDDSTRRTIRQAAGIGHLTAASLELLRPIIVTDATHLSSAARQLLF